MFSDIYSVLIITDLISLSILRIELGHNRKYCAIKCTIPMSVPETGATPSNRFFGPVPNESKFSCKISSWCLRVGSALLLMAGSCLMFPAGCSVFADHFSTTENLCSLGPDQQAVEIISASSIIYVLVWSPTNIAYHLFVRAGVFLDSLTTHWRPSQSGK